MLLAEGCPKCTLFHPMSSAADRFNALFDVDPNVLPVDLNVYTRLPIAYQRIILHCSGDVAKMDTAFQQALAAERSITKRRRLTALIFRSLRIPLVTSTDEADQTRQS